MAVSAFDCESGVGVGEELSAGHRNALRFKHFEPHRTFSNDFRTALARSVEFFHMCSTVPNLLQLQLFREDKVCRVLEAPVQAQRTSSNLL